MGTKLYVANLPEAPSAIALRAHFSACGVVSDVQLVPERNSGRGRGSAFVRMTSAAGAERALSQLNGAPFEGQLLLVEAAPDDAADRRGERARRASGHHEDQSGTRITLQFRELANMTYELDCAGVAIVIRVFFPGATAQWRVVAQAGREPDAPSTAASATSRLEAFRSVARACRESAGFPGCGLLDWEALEKTMTKVRAL